MGGVGSGLGFRWNRRRSKRFVGEYKCIDARSFPYKIMSRLTDSGGTCTVHGVDLHVFRDKMELVQKENGKKSVIEFSLSCGNYGNKRYWFVCPNSLCSRRYRKLFLTKTADRIVVFLCRCCLNLAYKSQNRTKLNRIIDRKWDLVHRLKCSSDFILDREKPKWMHWKTFNKVRSEIAFLDDLAIRGIAAMYPQSILGKS